MVPGKAWKIGAFALGFGILGTGVAGASPESDFASQAQMDYQTITDAVNGQFAKSMGFYTTLGWNTPPNVFDFLSGPRLEVGVGVGADLMNFPVLKTLSLGAVNLGSNFSLPDLLPAPFPVATARVGLMNGLDLGLKVSYLPNISISQLGFGAHYLGWGLDLRYKLLGGQMALPDVTVGVSWDTMKGGFSVTTDINQSSSYYDSTTMLTYNATVSGTNVYSLDWNTRSFGAKVEVGKDLGVIYPFAAVGFQRNSGTVSSTMKGTGVLNISGSLTSPYNLNLYAANGALPVVFEPKFVAGFDIGQGLHWAVVGESNGVDIAGSTSFRVQF